MDRGTQVNFPIVFRKLHRTSTPADLLTHHHHHQASGVGWTPMRPSLSRPKSLNFDSNQQKSRLFYTCESASPRLTYPNVVDWTTSSREQTPPFSSNSSVVSNWNKTKMKQHSVDEESTVSGTKLSQCGDQGSVSCRRTTDDLSWWRLHMSRAKLKATATTSELLSGFAMVAMVELQINVPTTVPDWLFVMFAVCTTVLVAVHIFALMISTYILPSVDAIAKLELYDMVSESPHERMRGFIQLAWAFSTVLGLFLFLVEVAIISWVKFWDFSFTAAIASTTIVIPVLIVFVLFVVHFYHSLVVHKYNASSCDIGKLEHIKKQLDDYNCPV